jgi:hypothetical protein
VARKRLLKSCSVKGRARHGLIRGEIGLYKNGQALFERGYDTAAEAKLEKRPEIRFV